MMSPSKIFAAVFAFIAATIAADVVTDYWNIAQAWIESTNWHILIIFIYSDIGLFNSVCFLFIVIVFGIYSYLKLRQYDYSILDYLGQNITSAYIASFSVTLMIFMLTGRHSEIVSFFSSGRVEPWIQFTGILLNCIFNVYITVNQAHRIKKLNQVLELQTDSIVKFLERHNAAK